MKKRKISPKWREATRIHFCTSMKEETKFWKWRRWRKRTTCPIWGLSRPTMRQKRTSDSKKFLTSLIFDLVKFFNIILWKYHHFGRIVSNSVCGNLQFKSMWYSLSYFSFIFNYNSNFVPIFSGFPYIFGKFNHFSFYPSPNRYFYIIWFIFFYRTWCLRLRLSLSVW